MVGCRAEHCRSKPNGTLDFYEVHYYNTYTGASIEQSLLASRELLGARQEGRDRRVLDGRHRRVAAADLYTNPHGSDYSGAWAWQYVSVDKSGTESGASTIWPAMQAPMNKLKAAHASDLTCPLAVGE